MNNKNPKITAENRKEKLELLCLHVFKNAAKGNPGNLEYIKNARISINNLNLPEGSSSFNEAARQGNHALKLTQTLTSKFNTLGDTLPLHDWLKKIKVSSTSQVSEHLENHYQKLRRNLASYKKRKAKQKSIQNDPTSSLKPISLKKGEHHPKSLSALTPAPHWEVLIDESGSSFDKANFDQAQGASKSGRLVAIVRKKEAELEDLRTDFHSVEESPENMDIALQRLMDTHDVGILGFTVLDTSAKGTKWLNHIIQLVRWILYMLPISNSILTQVNFKIEQRSQYNPETSHALDGIKEIIKGELNSLDRERFGNLSLSMEFCPKDYPKIAYADVVAYTWYSSSPECKDRLKRSQLLNHCLLQPHVDSDLPQLYNALSRHDLPPANQWYPLCLIAKSLGQDSLLHNWMNELGKSVRGSRDIWQSLFQEVQQRMRRKNVSINELDAAITWLKRHQPSSLSGELELEFVSAHLALANHQGHVDFKGVQALLELGKTLEEENAQAVCHAYLRAAVTTTNHFEFAVMKAHLKAWVEKPVAIPGRLNHAKLLSTLGQLEAFERRHSHAKDYFNRSLAVINKLTDETQAKRELLQTSTYLAMVELDDGNHSPQAARDRVQEIIADKTKKPLVPAARRFACGGSGDETYMHHLLLRACVSHPMMFTDEARTYLGHAQQWQWHDGHPWQLIHAYRGWLLMQQPTPDTQEASIFFHASLDICWDDSSGVTLHWIGAVVHALASNLVAGFEADIPQQAAPLALENNLPLAPHWALESLQALPTNANHLQRWGHFSECLPFNFH